MDAAACVGINRLGGGKLLRPVALFSVEIPLGLRTLCCFSPGMSSGGFGGMDSMGSMGGFGGRDMGSRMGGELVHSGSIQI